MYGPSGNQLVLFFGSPDVALDFVAGNIRTPENKTVSFGIIQFKTANSHQVIILQFKNLCDFHALLILPTHFAKLYKVVSLFLFYCVYKK